MKIGIISDIHSNYEALAAVMDAIREDGVEMIVNAGDNVGYSPFPDQCIRLLQDAHVEGVMGNYDEAVGYDKVSCGCGECCDALEAIRQASLKWTQGHVSGETREYLRSLPHYRMLGADFGKVLIAHGGLDAVSEHVYPENEEKLLDISERTGAALVVLGHTHRAFYRTVNDTVFVNPGSVGKPVDGDPRASYAVADINGETVVKLVRIRYPVERNISALVAAGLPEAIGDMLRHGRENLA